MKFSEGNCKTLATKKLNIVAPNSSISQLILEDKALVSPSVTRRFSSCAAAVAAMAAGDAENVRRAEEWAHEKTQATAVLSSAKRPYESLVDE